MGRRLATASAVGVALGFALVSWARDGGVDRLIASHPGPEHDGQSLLLKPTTIPPGKAKKGPVEVDFAPPSWSRAPYTVHFGHTDSAWWQTPAGHPSEDEDEGRGRGRGRNASPPVECAGAVAVGDRQIVSGDVSAGQTPLSGTLSADGPVVLSVTLDGPCKVGRIAVAVTGYSGDTTAPTLTWTAPPPGAVVGRRPELALGWSDEETGGAEPSGVDPASLVVLIDGEDRTEWLELGSTGAEGRVPLGAGLEAGAHTLHATIADFAQNPTSASRTFEVAREGPRLVIAQPADGEVLSTATPALELELSRADPDVHTLSAQLADTDISELFTWSGDIATATLPARMALSDGPATLVAALSDDGAETVETSATFLVDTTAPSLVVLAPAEGAVVTGARLDVRGTVTDATAIVVDVDGTPARVEGTRFEALDVPLHEGPTVTLTISATDAAGNRAEAATTVVVDTGPPVLTVDPVPDLTRSDWQTLTGTVTEDGPVEVRAGGIRATVEGAPGEARPWTVELPLSEGSNTVTVVAIDQAGARVTELVDITRDTTAPSATVGVGGAPVPGARVAVRVEGRDDGAIREVVLSVGDETLATGTELPLTTQWTVPSDAVPGSVFELASVVRDQAGNAVTATATVPVASSGLVVGRVLDDTTGLPLVGASVLAGASTTTTDAHGRYAIEARDGTMVEISLDGWTAARRSARAQTDAAIELLDARLTPLASPVVVPPDGATVGLSWHGAQRATATFTGATTDGAARVTALSPQALPLPPPEGVAVLGGVDVRSGGPLPGPVTLALTDAPAHTVVLRAQSPAGTWRVEADSATATSGEAGTWAWARFDEPASAPAPGTTLPAAITAPAELTGTIAASVEPDTLPSTGGVATLTGTSRGAAASGRHALLTAVEHWATTDGTTGWTPPREQHALMWRAGTDTVSTSASASASRAWSPARLREAVVELSLSSPEPGPWGVAAGPAGATLAGHGATAVIPAGALDTTIAARVRRGELWQGLPQDEGVMPVAAVHLELVGGELSLPIELQVDDAADALLDAGVGDLLLTRVVEVGDRPSLELVSLAEHDAGALVVASHAALGGVDRDGWYVFYSVSDVVGLVSGTAAAPGASRPVLQSPSLPFVSVADASGAYAVPVTGVAELVLEAEVPGTALRGSAQVSPLPGAEVTADIVLSEVFAHIGHSPADGATGVPVFAPLELVAERPIRAVTATDGHVLLESAAGDAIDLVIGLSVDGHTLTATPTAPLVPGTAYRARATGMLDHTGTALPEASWSFTTATTRDTSWSLASVTVTLPGDGGATALDAPAGSFPPGTTLTVLNEGNGRVDSAQADADGAISLTLTASLSDALLLTAADPHGRVETAWRTEFVGGDGTTAIGVAGGTVRGATGLEVRIPEGALARAATFQLAPFTPGAGDELPDVPGGHFAGALRLSSADRPELRSELDLAFPVPAAAIAEVADAGLALDDAFFYVFRRVDITDRDTGETKQTFELIDRAEVEGEGDEARVVTASPPYPGYERWGPDIHWSRYGASSALRPYLVQPAIDTYVFLMWSVDRLIPGRAVAGAVTGAVRRVTWYPGETVPDYVPVADVPVSGVDVTGMPLSLSRDVHDMSETVSVTGDDGRFLLFDPLYEGGPVRLSAVDTDGRVHTAEAFEVDRLDMDIAMDPSLAQLVSQGHFQNLATVDFTFPAAAPDTSPGLDLHLLELASWEDRAVNRGLVAQYAQLTLGIDTEHAVVTDIQVHTPDGTYPWGVVPDALDSDAYLAMDWLTSPGLPTGEPGAYAAVVTAVPDEGGAPVTERITWRVVAAGGELATLHGTPPAVVDGRTLPRPDAQGVPVGTYLRVVFTEPVVGVAEALSLRGTDGSGEVEVQISGTGPSGLVADLSAAPETPVTTVTVQPRRKLDFGVEYELSIEASVQDVDRDEEGQPAPMRLSPGGYRTSFTTARPRTLTPAGTGETYVSGGIAVAGQTAWVVESLHEGGTGSSSQFGELRAYDLSVPSAPAELPEAATFVFGPPRDLVARTEADGSDLVAVATGHRTRFELRGKAVYWHDIVSTPSNVHIFRARPGTAPQQVAAVSVGSHLLDGTAQALALHREALYVATSRKGLRLIDLEFAQGVWNSSEPADRTSSLETSGVGFGSEAIVATVPLLDQAGRHVMPEDVAVGDAIVDGRSQPVAAVAAANPDSALLVVLPLARAVAWQGPLRLDSDRISTATAVALTLRGDRLLAVVAGHGAVADTGGAIASAGLAVVDLTDPRAPEVLSTLPLRIDPGSLVVDGDLVVVTPRSGTDDDGTATLVDVSVPAQPRQVGTVDGVGGAAVAASDDLVVSSHFGFHRGDEPLGGVRVADLSPDCFLLDLETGKAVFKTNLNPLDQRPTTRRCGNAAVVQLSMCRAGYLSVDVSDGPDLVGWVDPDFDCSEEPPEPEPISRALLGEGRHTLLLPYRENVGEPLEAGRVVPPERELLLTVEDAADPDLVDEASAALLHRQEARPAWPVAHTFVSGVDVHDGHLVHQATDLSLPGRHIGLTFTRSYSSAGLPDPTGVLGVGWSWNLGGTVHENPECGEVTVVTGEGGGQKFTTEDWARFDRGVGAQGRLEADGLHAYDWFDASGRRYHFEDLSGRESRDCPPQFRLAYIEEPHGDRLVPEYDEGRIVAVGEVHPEAGETPVRRLEILTDQVAGADRVVRVRGHGLEVAYGYDDHGNLIRVQRSGRTAPVEQWPSDSCRPDDVERPPEVAETLTVVETYDYSVDSPRDRHQLVEHVDVDGNMTTWRWHRGATPSDEAIEGLPWGELVEAVEQHVDDETVLQTVFEYDFSELASSDRHETIVTDARGNGTRYLLDGYGAVWEEEDLVLGARTVTSWRDDDVLVDWTEDALGRRTSYTYDTRGNPETTTIHSTFDGAYPGFGDVLTRQTWHPDFGRLVGTIDPGGHEHLWELDDVTGDLLQEIDAVGNVTRYDYEAGLLVGITGPRGSAGGEGHTTRYAGHTSFGLPTETIDPLGLSARTTYDQRGAARETCDEAGRYTRWDYDPLGRLVGTFERGGESEDRIQHSVLNPSGSTHASTTVVGPDNLVTRTFEYDGLGRVTKRIERIELPGESDAEQRVHELAYDGNGNLRWERTPTGAEWEIVTDAEGRTLQRTLVRGPSTTTPKRFSEATWDLVGNQLTEVDAVLGATTTFSYDGLYQRRSVQLPIQRTDGSAATEQLEYDHDGRLMAAVDMSGERTAWTYDEAHRRITETDALGHLTTWTWEDPEGSHSLVSQVHDHTRGLRTTFEHDAMGRTISTVQHLEGPGGDDARIVIEVEHDDVARTARTTMWQETTAGAGRADVVEVELDTLGQLVRTEVDPDGLGLTTLQAYDGGGRVGWRRTARQVEDPDLGQSQLVHDALGRQVRATDATGATATARWHDIDGVAERTDRRGVVTTFAYDDLGRTTEAAAEGTLSGVSWSRRTEYADETRTTVLYDGTGELDRAMRTVTDALGRRVAAIDPSGATASVTYDGDREVATTDRKGQVSRRDHDALGRVVRVTAPEPLGYVREICRLDAENRRVVRTGRGAVTVEQRDPLGRLRATWRTEELVEASVIDEDGACTELAALLCTEATPVPCVADQVRELDHAGRPVRQVDAAGRETRFEYDGAGRLQLERAAAGTEREAVTRKVYDADGNLEELWLPGDVDAPTLRHTYDALGRLLSTADATGATTRFGYDAEGNQVSVERPLGHPTRYRYDELGKLLCAVRAAPEDFVFDERGEVLCQPGPDVAVTQYVYDTNRNLVSRIDAEGRQVRMAYDTHNRLQSTELFPDQAPWADAPSGRALTTSITYDANGNVETSTNGAGDVLSTMWDALDRPLIREHRPGTDSAGEPVRYVLGHDAHGNLRTVDRVDPDTPGATPEVVDERQVDALDRLELRRTTTVHGSADVGSTWYADGSRGLPDRARRAHRHLPLRRAGAALRGRDPRGASRA